MESINKEAAHLDMQGDARRKIFLLIDGYDEYRRGINADIDKTIAKDLHRNCLIVLTSRETEELPVIREYMDSEAKILGFSEANMEEYTIRPKPALLIKLFRKWDVEN